MKLHVRNVLMMLCVMLFVFAAACGDDEKKQENNQDLSDVQGDQDTGHGEEDVSDQDVDESPSCEPLSPAIGACDALCNTGCDEGTACMTGRYSSGMSSKCVNDGPHKQGELCSPDVGDGCVGGHGCFSIEDKAPACFKYCRTDVSAEEQCAEGHTCKELAEETPGLGICAILPDAGCTIYPNAGCEAGEQCFPWEGGTTCAPFNTSAEVGDDCASLNGCNENQYCVPDEASRKATCTAFCPTPGETSGCGEGLVCVGLQGATFGLCKIAGN